MDYRFIPLTLHGIVLAYTMVDAADFAVFSQFKWSLHKSGYAFREYGSSRSKERGRVFLHREILGLPRRRGNGPSADHINHDPLDNRRSNLRTATISENGQNRRADRDSSTPYRGVHFCADRNKYRAVVCVRENGKKKRLQLGLFTDANAAAEAVRAKRLELQPFATD